MTKQLNKKGTSLVELIAVIVIMGIIAGIAVPVTISVINRQKKNAAAKSAEAVIATMKQLTQELIATASGQTITITLVYGDEDGATNKPSATPTVNDGQARSYTADEFMVENLKATGTITSTYTIADASYSFNTTTQNSPFKVNNYSITANADGTCSAS